MEQKCLVFARRVQFVANLKNIMKLATLFSTIFISLTLFTTIIGPATAAPDIGLGNNGLAGQIAKKGGYDTAGVDDTTLSQSIGRIIKVALSLVGTIFLILTIYAGILWMTAQGNEEAVEKAQGIIKTATIGLILVIAAYGITVFVLLSITAAAGLPGTQVGGGGIGGVGFWKSFGNQIKNGGWQTFVP